MPASTDGIIICHTASRRYFFEKLKKNLSLRASRAETGNAAMTATAATSHSSTSVRERSARHVPMPDTARIMIKTETVFFSMPDFMPLKQMSLIQVHKDTNDFSVCKIKNKTGALFSSIWKSASVLSFVRVVGFGQRFGFKCLGFLRREFALKDAETVVF